jgi:hypothetical protein
MVGSGDIRNIIKSFFKVLCNHGNVRLTEFPDFLIVIELTDDTIRFPLFCPCQNTIDTDRFAVMSRHTTKSPGALILGVSRDPPKQVLTILFGKVTQ